MLFPKVYNTTKNYYLVFTFFLITYCRIYDRRLTAVIDNLFIRQPIFFYSDSIPKFVKIKCYLNLNFRKYDRKHEHQDEDKE